MVVAFHRRRVVVLAFCSGTALEATGDQRGALRDFRDVLALNPALADAVAAKYAGLATRIVLYNALTSPERVERYGEVARRLQC